MLVRLLYASRAAESVHADTLHAILKVSKEHNHAVGVTGVLCHCATSKIFMQVLEGGRGPVSALYNRIAQDPRHRDIVLLSYEEIAERSFSGWSMGQVSMSRLEPGPPAQVLGIGRARPLRGAGQGLARPLQRAGGDGLGGLAELAARRRIAARVSAAAPRRAWPRWWRWTSSPSWPAASSRRW